MDIYGYLRIYMYGYLYTFMDILTYSTLDFTSDSGLSGHIGEDCFKEPSSHQS